MTKEPEGMTRTFIAVEISEAVKSELSSLISSLKDVRADVKWVKLENLHLTLKFLGQTTGDQVALVKESLQEIVSKERPFLIHFSGLGGFPSLKRPRVLWVGIDEGAEFLKELSERVESTVAAIGFLRENRPFSAHLTLGRVRPTKNLQGLISKVKETRFCSAEKIEVNSLSFYKSVLTPAGSIYELIQKSPFLG